MSTFKFDIMLNGRFVCTLRYKYCALFPIDFEDLNVKMSDVLFNLIRRKDYVPDNPVVV